MSTIKKLPQYLINKLKAWEIVDRPASIVKELLENSIDAWADNILIEIKDWWKKLIKIQDNWSWISTIDLPLSIERYATSKIEEEKDLYNISTYWFRGEALASISEVSKFKIQTKVKSEPIWYELNKIDGEVSIDNIPFPYDSGTIVYIEDIFYNTPARLKFLKSAQTEWSYINSLVIDLALINYNIWFTLIKDGKTILSLKKSQDQYSRIFDIFDKSFEKNIFSVEKKDDNVDIYWLVSDSALSFAWLDNIKIYVNQRSVQDKIIRKALLDAYDRQLAPWMYPFAVLFININPSLVDVNVHPRKLEVKFQDPWSMYNLIKNLIIDWFSKSKISWWDIKQVSFSNHNNYIKTQTWSTKQDWFDFQFQKNLLQQSEKSIINELNTQELNFQILWQIWDSYIVIQSDDGIYFVDQHAIAERIAFENMRKDIEKNWLKSWILLNPLTIWISKNLVIEDKILLLQKLWFDISLLSDSSLVIYAVPQAFIDYQVDINILINKIIYLEDISLNVIFDNILAQKACKISIKAGEKLSNQQMNQLIKDWFDYITWMFVCQHGRPSFIKVSKENIDKLFDR